MKRLDGMLLRGLAATAGLWPDLQRVYEWVWQAAHLLANEEERPVADLQAAYADLVATIAAQRGRIPTLTAALDHFLKSDRQLLVRALCVLSRARSAADQQ